jgi:hypothetical protein
MTARSIAPVLLATTFVVVPSAALAGCTSGTTPDCDASSICDPYESGSPDGSTETSTSTPESSTMPETSTTPETGTPGSTDSGAGGG